MHVNAGITLAIVAVTFVGIAIGHYPVIKSNRTTIALMGVALLVVFGQVRFEDVPSYMNFDTLILLFSMMIINANLKFAGFFTLAARTISRYAHTPRAFLILEILVAGILSAFFLNDTICLMFAPLILTLMDSYKRNPLPYLLALAMASNVGSTATLTGNPQNMIIGTSSGISYIDFALALLPVALLGMGVIWLVLVWFYPKEFKSESAFETSGGDAQEISRPLLTKTLLVTGGLLVAFIAGVPIALASFIAANLLLITRRHQPHLVFAEFDWSLLVFFGALFVVSGSLETSGVIRDSINLEEISRNANVLNLTVISAVLSNLVSNVPAVLLLRPVVSSMPDAHTGWLTLAASSTLAGNLTLVGSVANLIVAEIAARWRVEISFWEYTRAGIVVTLVTLLISVLWLYWI
jgi:Na+/H+ antiporter NhaD/arsenite permease-like protein